MGIVMVAMLAFGGTFAFFTATASGKTATITTAKLGLVNGSTFTTSLTNVVPGDEIIGAKAVKFSTTGATVDSYVAIKATFAVDGQTKTAADLAEAGITLSFDSTNWEETDTGSSIFVYKGNSYKVAKETDVYLNTEAIKFQAKENNVDNTSTLKYMGKTITITFAGYSIQTTHLSDSFTPSASTIWTAIAGAASNNSYTA